MWLMDYLFRRSSKISCADFLPPIDLSCMGLAFTCKVSSHFASINTLTIYLQQEKISSLKGQYRVVVFSTIGSFKGKKITDLLGFSGT
jgi:hypothetical protein